MIVTARCTACGRKTLRMDASTVATTIHRRTCKCGARYCLKVTPVIHTEQMTVHTIDGEPMPQDKVCERCRLAKQRASWRCRNCTRRVCDHLAKNKTNDGDCLCGRCALAD